VRKFLKKLLEPRDFRSIVRIPFKRGASKTSREKGGSLKGSFFRFSVFENFFRSFFGKVLDAG
jgi:hypothetical protein